MSGESQDGTTHDTIGEVGGHEVVVTVQGSESQDLPDGSRIGSDVLMHKINSKLTDVKQSVEDNDRSEAQP